MKQRSALDKLKSDSEATSADLEKKPSKNSASDNFQRSSIDNTPPAHSDPEYHQWNPPSKTADKKTSNEEEKKTKEDLDIMKPPTEEEKAATAP